MTAPIVVFKKKKGMTIKEVGPIYRSVNLPLPVVGDAVVVINLESGEEEAGKVTFVNEKENTYYFSINKIERGSE